MFYSDNNLKLMEYTLKADFELGLKPAGIYKYFVYQNFDGNLFLSKSQRSELLTGDKEVAVFVLEYDGKPYTDDNPEVQRKLAELAANPKPLVSMGYARWLNAGTDDG